MTKCLRCGKEFWVKHKKNKETPLYCQKCRNAQSMAAHQVKRESIHVRVVSQEVSYKGEVEALRRVEIYNPRLLDKLRKIDEKEETL